MKQPPVATALTVLIPLLAVAAAASAATRPPRPEMKLRVSTHHGYLPLTVTLEGKLAEAGPAAIERCLVSVEWSHTTPGGLKLNSKEESPCVEPPAEVGVPESFKKDVTLDEPGTYSYRIILVGKEGKRYASASQEVTAMRSQVELGAKAGRGDGPR